MRRRAGAQKRGGQSGEKGAPGAYVRKKLGTDRGKRAKTLFKIREMVYNGSKNTGLLKEAVRRRKQPC